MTSTQSLDGALMLNNGPNLVTEAKMSKLKGGDKLYRESLEASAKFNKRLIDDRKGRIPYLDGQTRVAQSSNGNLWLMEYQRREAKKGFSSGGDGYLYTYPVRKWVKRRRMIMLRTPTPSSSVHFDIGVSSSISGGSGAGGSESNLYRLLQMQSQNSLNSAAQQSTMNGELTIQLGGLPQSLQQQQSQSSQHHQLNENSNSMDSMLSSAAAAAVAAGTASSTTNNSNNMMMNNHHLHNQVLIKQVSGSLSLSATANNNDDLDELNNGGNGNNQQQHHYGAGNHQTAANNVAYNHHHHNSTSSQLQQQNSFYSIDDPFDNIDTNDIDNDSDNDFDYEDSSSRRRKKKGKKEPTSRKKSDQMANGEKKLFVCEYCQTTYKTKPGLTYHVNKAHAAAQQQKAAAAAAAASAEVDLSGSNLLMSGYSDSSQIGFSLNNNSSSSFLHNTNSNRSNF